MATKKEINDELKIALKEVGKIKPWFEPDFDCWVFSHPLYSVECEGKSAADVIKKYPQYLRVFIEHRIKGKLDLIEEKKTKGKGGYRPGSGRPVGTLKEPTKQKRLPADVVNWFEIYPYALEEVRKLMNRSKTA